MFVYMYTHSTHPHFMFTMVSYTFYVLQISYRFHIMYCIPHIMYIHIHIYIYTRGASGSPIPSAVFELENVKKQLAPR